MHIKYTIPLAIFILPLSCAAYLISTNANIDLLQVIFLLKYISLLSNAHAKIHPFLIFTAIPSCCIMFLRKPKTMRLFLAGSFRKPINFRCRAHFQRRFLKEHTPHCQFSLQEWTGLVSHYFTMFAIQFLHFFTIPVLYFMRELTVRFLVY